MKFTDGYWLMRPGVTARYATEVADVRADEHRMTLYAPVKHVDRRAGILNSALLTVECWSPAEGVIGVRATHHAGSVRKAPEFALPGAQPDAGKVGRDGSVVELSAGELSLRVDTSQPWNLEFTAGGRLLTSVGERGTGFVTDAGGRHFMLGQLALGVGESVYGLGERFTPFVKNGQTVDIWQADGGTSSEQAYKNIPFHLTNRGYGVFVNHPGKVSYEVGSESVGQVQFSVEDQSLEFFVVHGPTPKQILQRYTALTGRPALPPAWALGLWLTTSFTTDYDEATVNRFVDGMAERGIPLSVFHFDCFWMRGYQWCDFDWDSETFPDPEGMLARLKERGLRISAWINPYIAQKSPLFEEGMREGHLVRRPDGSVWQWDLWQAGMALVDFTNPAARDWYTGKLKTLLAQGVDCFKTDFGERIPTDVVWHDGSDPERMHNYYTHLFNQAVFELLREERGEGEALLFARSATAGGQQYPVHWGGDCESHFGAMAESLRGGLSLGLSGFGFWSHDIGGFEGTPTPAVFKRWVQFGLLSSHSRLHGSKSYRVPWDYGEEAVDVTRQFTLLKHRLAPYLQRAAQQAHTTGVPVMRAMVLEFPDDPAAATLDRQYMLGDDLLVAPVFTDDGTVEYYVPEGAWTNVLTGAQVTGPRWVREQHDFHTLPLLARPDSVIALAADDQQPVSAWADGVELRVHAFADGAERTVVIPRIDGPGETARFHLRRRGDRLHVATDSPHPWQLRIGGPNATVHTRPAGTSEAELPYPA
ncbi:MULTISPECIES: alpha-xylosidase [unclassified Streptomyces]|uniref:alpha-xylosidase n=1 Tax=unclassified Streptomyces TaxID=2593676 RepID=UPI00225699A7|nr:MULTISPECIES: alpha-xylosidase [unclassified Streptomyces]MCX5058894.1 alpha-xylosidase [Streptomyces sp. NBC_00452]MCX5290042.1 alpha-xylosidase [Streptomyces sp. NBC_00183]